MRLLDPIDRSHAAGTQEPPLRDDRLVSCGCREKAMREPVMDARRALGEMLAAARRSAGGARALGEDQVAERAGVGLSWYRWLEDGRNIGVSPTALGWVADALALRGAARRRLFELAGLEESDELPAMIEPVRP